MDEAKMLVGEQAILIERLECGVPAVVEFFRQTPEQARLDLVCQALATGVAGLHAMGVARQVGAVELEFARLADKFRDGLEHLESRLIERVDATFDPDQAESVSAKLGLAVADTHNRAVSAMTVAKAELEQLVGDVFNPDLATSCVSRVTKLVSDTKVDLERSFDPSYQGSYLSRLAETVEEYFGDDGSIADVVAKQLSPVKEELVNQLHSLRDLVAGQSASAELRRLAPVSGFDFEDEVESHLRRLAKSYGDSVQRVGTVPGTAGAAKSGDFVVELRQGPRFAIEAKDHSNPITLRGDRGILKALDDSMVNRKADFAICVMKDETGFPKEVGAFNDYDEDKLLCAFGIRGDLLEAAYRWARAVLLARSAKEDGIDAQLVQSAIAEARLALRELKSIEGKAKAIAKTADDIRGLLTFQMRRAQSALDEAERGIQESARRESA